MFCLATSCWERGIQTLVPFWDSERKPLSRGEKEILNRLERNCQNSESFQEH